MIAIVDYGMGNLRSVEKACEHAGLTVKLSADPGLIRSAAGVILPGVGAFGRAMTNLQQAGLVEPLQEKALSGQPFLGICLGLQLLFAGSEERFGGKNVPGLGVVPGFVRRFPPGLKIPQIGWNQLTVAKFDPLLAGVGNHAYVYFVHSYYVEPEDPNWVLTRTDYGLSFASSISRGLLYGIQFHPEKSSAVGMLILKNFGAMVDAYISSH